MPDNSKKKKSLDRVFKYRFAASTWQIRGAKFAAPTRAPPYPGIIAVLLRIIDGVVLFLPVKWQPLDAARPGGI